MGRHHHKKSSQTNNINSSSATSAASSANTAAQKRQQAEEQKRKTAIEIENLSHAEWLQRVHPMPPRLLRMTAPPQKSHVRELTGFRIASALSNNEKFLVVHCAHTETHVYCTETLNRVATLSLPAEETLHAGQDDGRTTVKISACFNSDDSLLAISSKRNHVDEKDKTAANVYIFSTKDWSRVGEVVLDYFQDEEDLWYGRRIFEFKHDEPLRYLTSAIAFSSQNPHELFVAPIFSDKISVYNVKPSSSSSSSAVVPQLVKQIKVPKKESTASEKKGTSFLWGVVDLDYVGKPSNSSGEEDEDGDSSSSSSSSLLVKVERQQEFNYQQAFFVFDTTTAKPVPASQGGEPEGCFAQQMIDPGYSTSESGIGNNRFHLTATSSDRKFMCFAVRTNENGDYGSPPGSRNHTTVNYQSLACGLPSFLATSSETSPTATSSSSSSSAASSYKKIFQTHHVPDPHVCVISPYDRYVAFDDGHLVHFIDISSKRRLYTLEFGESNSQCRAAFFCKRDASFFVVDDNLCIYKFSDPIHEAKWRAWKRVCIIRWKSKKDNLVKALNEFVILKHVTGFIDWHDPNIKQQEDVNHDALLQEKQWEIEDYMRQQDIDTTGPYC